ncbi:MAG: tRNA1(Val) (adenine(37)-N6)-methyltransferase [Saprospiraceae bacterium]
MARAPFHFSNFSVQQPQGVFPVGSDALLLSRWADIGAGPRILDVGAGTGIVSLILAERAEARYGQAFGVTGVEVNETAAHIASRNFEASPWRANLRIAHEDIRDYASRRAEAFDLIASNPPFFDHLTRPSDPARLQARSTHTLTQHQLLEASLALLSESGILCVILPMREGKRFAELAALRGLYARREACVFSTPEKPPIRLLLEFSRNPRFFSKEKICL